MISYLMKHWRGQHHVAWGLFVNGLLGCIVVMLAWEIVRDSTPLNWSQQVLWVNLAVFWAWFLWAAAGILRSALRALREPNSWLTKAVAVLALIAVLGSAYGFVSDLPDVIKGTPRLGGPIRIGKPGSVPRTRSVAPAGRTQIVVQWLDTAQGSMELREIYKIENALESVSDGKYFVDGHDVGSGTVNVFLYAEDSKVDAAIAVVVSFFEQGKLVQGMRIGRAIYEDEKRRNWHFQPVYPPGLAEFQIMYRRRTAPPN